MIRQAMPENLPKPSNLRSCLRFTYLLLFRTALFENVTNARGITGDRFLRKAEKRGDNGVSIKG